MQEREGRAGRAGPLVVLRVPALARAASVRQGGVSQVLHAVRGPQEHDRRARSNGSVQRDVYYAQGAQYPSACEAALFARQRAGQRLRQPDRVRPQQPAGRLPLLRPAPAQDEAEGHPPLRHVRADPRGPGEAAHVGPGGEGRRSSRSSRWATSTAASCTTGLTTAAGATAIPTRASRAARSATARSTASRTS